MNADVTKLKNIFINVYLGSSVDVAFIISVHLRYLRTNIPCMFRV